MVVRAAAQLSVGGWVVAKIALSQPHTAEIEGHRAELVASVHHQLSGAAADVNHHVLTAYSREIRGGSCVGEGALLDPAQQLSRRTTHLGCRSQEVRSVLCVAHRGRRDEARPGDAEPVHVSPKRPQHRERPLDGRRCEHVGGIDLLAQTRDLHSTSQTFAPGADDQQARRVRSAVDRSDRFVSTRHTIGFSTR